MSAAAGLSPESAARIEALVERCHRIASPETRAEVGELFSLVLELHGRGLRRMLGTRPEQWARDPEISALCELHQIELESAAPTGAGFIPLEALQWPARKP